jgi:hypothetical protein
LNAPVLVEKPINASLGNKAFSKKRQVYPRSKLLLAQAIAERPKIGVNTSIDRAVQDLESFKVWNEASINERQENLRSLALKIWRVPTPTIESSVTASLLP